MKVASSLRVACILGIGISGCESKVVSRSNGGENERGTNGSAGGANGGAGGQAGSTAMGASGETGDAEGNVDGGTSAVSSGGVGGGASGSGGNGATSGAANATGGTASGGSSGSSSTDGGAGGGGPSCTSIDTLDHCGACDEPCDASHASMRCAAGDCVIDSCLDGYCNIDGNPRNGCEEPVNLFSDPEHCGACGSVCTSGVCTGGHCPTRAFVTSVAYKGDLGGLNGADQKCQELAQAEGLGGTWKAWLSTDAVSAAARLAHTVGPVARLDGIIIADDWTDLTDGVLAYSLTVNELGETISASNYAVWTNTNSDGSSYGINDCTDWTTSSFDIVAVQGSSDYVDARWSVLSPSSECGLDAHLYCFEQ